MELVSGKLYEAIMTLNGIPENYDEIGYFECKRTLIKKGCVLMFVEKKTDNRESELIFLHEGKLITGAASEVDQKPHLYFKEALF